MADEQNNELSVNPPPERPKRTRKRKTEAEMPQSIGIPTQTHLAQTHLAQTHLAQTHLAQTQLEPLPDTTVESDTTSGDVSIAELSASEVPPTPAESTVPVATVEHSNIDTPIAEPVENQPAVHLSGCGGALKTAREAQGYSIAEVSKQLRLSVIQIQAMEKDDFAKLPHKTIVRGFIRNYAKLLKIDADPLLAAYQAMMPDGGATSGLTVKANADPSVIRTDSAPKRSMWFFNPLVFLLIFSLLTYFYVVHIKPQSLTTASQPLEAASEPADEANIPVAIESDNSDHPSDTPVESAEANLNVKPDETPLPEPAIAQAAATAAATQSESTNSTVNTAQSENKVLLVFRVTDDSWVRIEDAQGKKVFSQIMKPGNEQSMTLEKPLNITVGNASVTKLSVDNQPFDLSQATKGRVARVQLK